MTKTMPTNGQFCLIELPYEKEALSPVISAETLQFHHGKHLQTYVNNLNALIKGSKYEGLSLEEIVCQSDGGVFNNAGQMLNHNLYFCQFGKNLGAENKPSGDIANLIDSQFGSFDEFKKEFEAQGAKLFGSGWVWLSISKEGKLIISQETNAGNPLTKGNTPLLTFDVWEHAYYLDYQNLRPTYIASLWQIINWDEVNNRLR